MNAKLLREFIKQQLAEMPLAKLHPFTDVKPPDGKTPIDEPEKKKVKKYYDSWREDSFKTYNNLSVPIHVVPGYSPDIETLSTRTYQKSSTGLDEYLLNNQTPNMSDETKNELLDAVDRGDAVIITTTTRLRKGFLPTPWIIVHSMYDDPYMNETQSPSEAYFKLIKLIVNEEDRNPQQDWDLWYEALTMKSARDRKINAPTDIVGEILTQAVLNRNGFQYNKTQDPEFNKLLAHIADIVSGERSEFEKRIAGKVSVVSID